MTTSTITVDREAVKGGAFIPSLSRSCIIEEQADHLIVAVRIPKATIAENLALFVALAERSGVEEGQR